MPKKIPTSLDVDTEADLRFMREEEAKKYYSKRELEMVEATAARIKKVVANEKRRRFLAAWNPPTEPN